MISLIAVRGRRTYGVRLSENNNYYLVVKDGMREIKSDLIKGDDERAITGYVAACAKAETLVDTVEEELSGQ